MTAQDFLCKAQCSKARTLASRWTAAYIFQTRSKLERQVGGEQTMIGYLFRTLTGRSALQKALRRHFRCRTSADIVTASREFPITSRVDVQTALQRLFAEKPKTRLFGIHWQMNQETLTLAHLFSGGPFPIDVGPLQHDEVDIGDSTPVRCLKNGLWLSWEDQLPFARPTAPINLNPRWHHDP